MGSPLAPVLAAIFMVELERAVIPKHSQHNQFWKRYIDDTSCFVRNGYQEFVLSCLNSFRNSFSLHMKLKKNVDKKLRRVFIENLQIQTYSFMGIHLHHFHGNVAYRRR